MALISHFFTEFDSFAG